MAQRLIAASTGLEGKVTPETATALGDQLRLISSYYSNLNESCIIYDEPSAPGADDYLIDAGHPTETYL